MSFTYAITDKFSVPLPDFKSIIDTRYSGTFHFVSQDRIWLFIPLALILLFFIFKSFVRINPRKLADKKFRMSRLIYRILLLLSRLLLLALLVAFLAGPVGELRHDIPGDLSVTVLIDNSSSMEMFDVGFTDSLIASLRERIPVEVKYVASGKRSALGDELLGVLRRDKNVLMISDGQVTEGTQMADVLLYSRTLNASISSIYLEEVKEDVSVRIVGPSQTLSDVETNYKVVLDHVKGGGDAAGSIKEFRLKVSVDGIYVIDEVLASSVEEKRFSRNFTSGYHNISASIEPLSGADYFKDNNIFFKTTHVVPKPKILFVTQQESALKVIFDELYETTQVSSVPSDRAELEPYYAVVLNDLPASELKSVGALQDFVVEGGGLFVVGGYNSFDNGQYKGSGIEALLPVTLGTGKRERGNANVVLVIDISGSTGFEYGSAEKAVDVEKSLAISVIEDMNEGNRVGVVAFNNNVYKIADIEPLFINEADIKDKISRLVDGGYTVLNLGLRGAFELLQGKAGSKNVVWITDGVTLDPIDLQETANIAQAMHEYGIKLYVIGVGRNANEEYLSDIGQIGDGFYVKATDSHRLKILFGEPEQKTAGSAFDLFILNSNHFITEDLALDAVLYGYNQVVPKQSAQLLVTTDFGEPAVTVWRHGIGRVATLTVFSSGNNLGELLEARNSRLLTRVTNWAIGDPERKNAVFILIEDARLGGSSEVIVRSDVFPIHPPLVFSKTDKDTYSARIENKEVGFKSVLHASFAVNYEREFESLGEDEEFGSAVLSSGGKVFKPSEVDDIIEHIRNMSRRSVVEQVSFRFEFLFAALVLLALEIIVRRIRDNWVRS